MDFTAITHSTSGYRLRATITATSELNIRNNGPIPRLCIHNDILILQHAQESAEALSLVYRGTTS